ncbi:protein TAPETUM DETERMINANT 1-like [Sesamum indicum]|uniref:Protein TAPETUM DETERMINANT 1-like n=1 Tax=Sesamum indicum TaxID=4182 RepID=A0A6I9STC6_SESIN|nr:protein TAPETUM DETERMINANT 1-like [Sesamum indicum]
MNCESSSSLRRRRVASFTAVFAVTILLLIIGIYTDHGLMEFNPILSQKRSSARSVTHRKLLKHAADSEDGKGVEPNRIWGDKCSKSDIVISQGATEPLPNGIPTYTVDPQYPRQLRLVQLCPPRQPPRIQAAPLQ